MSEGILLGLSDGKRLRVEVEGSLEGTKDQSFDGDEDGSADGTDNLIFTHT